MSKTQLDFREKEKRHFRQHLESLGYNLNSDNSLVALDVKTYLSRRRKVAEFAKLLEEFERGRLWCSIEVNFSSGALNYIRKITTHRYRANGKDSEKEYR